MLVVITQFRIVFLLTKRLRSRSSSSEIWTSSMAHRKKSHKRKMHPYVLNEFFGVKMVHIMELWSAKWSEPPDRRLIAKGTASDKRATMDGAFADVIGQIPHARISRWMSGVPASSSHDGKRRRSRARDGASQDTIRRRASGQVFSGKYWWRKQFGAKESPVPESNRFTGKSRKFRFAYARAARLF
jgi:hypothetical protein